MRRLLSIWMMLLLGLPPMASALSFATGDIRLPACCRRHGAHHCGMIDPADSAATPAGQTATVAAHCPFLSRVLPASTTSVHARPGLQQTISALSASPYLAATRSTRYRLSPLHQTSGRAPPITLSV